MYSIPLVLSSSVNNGATEKSEDGSTFTINLERPIIIPKEAKNCWIEIQSALVWNSVPNILTGVNDKFYFTYNLTPYILTLEKGQYDLEYLNIEINRQITSLGLPNNLILFRGDSATSKVVIEYLDANITIDFTQTDTFRELLGFNSQILSSAIINFQKGDTTARFNTINYFLIHSDLVNLGLRYNTQYRQIVSEVLIDVPAGSQIISRPYNIPKIPAPELIGTKRRRINVWITDDLNNRVDTNGEDYSFRMTINYVM